MPLRRADRPPKSRGGSPLAVQDAAYHEGEKRVLANHFRAAAFEK
jgi:hypothetical protein